MKNRATKPQSLFAKMEASKQAAAAAKKEGEGSEVK